jgi:hypothetical protein
MTDQFGQSTESCLFVFDPPKADPILNLQIKSQLFGINYATSSWNQSAGFHIAYEGPSRAEANPAERQFWTQEHAFALLSDGVHGHVYNGDV